MATITGTKGYDTQLSGKRLIVVTATIESASDQIVLSLATHGVRTIYGVFGQITAGMDADFQALQISFSSLTITIVSKQADGANSDEWTGTTISLLCLVD